MITETLVTGLSLAGIYVILFWLVGSYQVDSVRQKMFALRDEWFDYAASGGISFDHPVYGRLRRMMNAYIRFAHRLDLGCLGFRLTLNREERKWLSKYNPNQSLDEAIAELDEPTKKVVKQLRGQMSVLVAKHIFLSPFAVIAVFFAVLPALVVALILRANVIGAKKLWATCTRDIDVAALAQRGSRTPLYR